MNEKDCEMVKVAKRAYMKQWRKNNPGKCKQHMMNYWLKKAREGEAKNEPK